MQPIWTESFRVASYLVDSHEELGLPGLLGLIQESAWEHAEQLGYGYAPMLERGLIWALIRQELEIRRWPRWGETVTVRTWLRPLQGLLVARDFEFSLRHDTFCHGTTLYLMLENATRRPAPATLGADAFYDRERGAFEPGKIAPRPGLTRLARFPIRTSDLDMHAHVNNTRIAQWILDAVPPEAHKQQRVHSYEVDFLAEMHGGESIAIEAGPLGDGKWHFQGRREGDSKVVFAARVGIGPR